MRVQETPSNPQQRTTLTLDLGTHTGWTLLQGDQLIASGTHVLATPDELMQQRKAGMERTLDIRFSRFMDFMLGHFHAGVQRVVFEDVQFAKSQAQAQVWASLRSAIWAAAQNLAIEIRCVQVGTLKLFATGAGGAQKNDMGRALVAAEPGKYRLAEDEAVVRADGARIDDNEVDAIWLARFTVAVDRGEQAFLSQFERKRAAALLKRARKAEKRAKRKARNEGMWLALQAKRRARLTRLKVSRRSGGMNNKTKVKMYETTKIETDEKVVRGHCPDRTGAAAAEALAMPPRARH